MKESLEEPESSQKGAREDASRKDATEGGSRGIEKKDLSELKDRLASIIKQIGGKRDVVVTTELSYGDIVGIARIGQDPSDTWFQRDIRDPKTGEVKGILVHIPEKIFEASEDAAKGKAAHEAGHVAIARSGRFVPDRVLQELGFHHLLLASEEPPADQVVRDRYEGAGRWVDDARKSSAIEGEEAFRTKNKLGYIPKSIQFNNLLVYGRHFEGIPEYYDQGVVELYERLQRHIAAIEHAIPAEDASEQEIVKQAKKRYAITYKRLWPEVKKLVQGDLETEKLRQMLNQAGAEQEKPADESEKGPGDEVQKALESLSEEFQKELERAMEELSKEKEEQGERGEQEEASEAGEESGGDEAAGKETAREAEETTEGESMPEAREETEGVPMRESEEEKQGGTPIPMDRLSEKLLEALQKAYDKLPENLKKALEERAKKILEEIEDQFVEDLSPKLAQGGETHEEYRARVAQEEEEEKTKEEKTRVAQSIQEEMKEIERRQAALHATRDVYDKTYDELRALDEKLYRELEEIFTPNIKRNVKLRATGAKINLPAVFRWEAGRKGGAPQIDSKIFESVHLPEKKDYVFTLLNDLSGSMEGEKILEDFKAKVLLAEVLNRLGVKNELLGFQDEVIVFKTFDEELTDDIRKKMSGMLLETMSINPGGHNRSGENYDGPCLIEASKGLEAQPGKEKFLIVISDGLPTGPFGGYSAGEYLTKAVKEVLTTTDQKLIGLGLGPDTEHVKEYYPVSFPNLSVKDLSGILADLLKDMIVNPQHYAFKP